MTTRLRPACAAVRRYLCKGCPVTVCLTRSGDRRLDILFQCDGGRVRTLCVADDFTRDPCRWMALH